jgi:hypothetical protein
MRETQCCPTRVRERSRLTAPTIAPASRSDARALSASAISQRPCARLDRKHVGGVSVCFGVHGLHCALTGHVEPWIAKGHPARLRSREGLTGARERAFLLGQRREQVPTNGVYGPAETSIRMYVMAAFGPLNPDPHRAVGSYVLILFLCPFCQKRIE